MIAKKSSGERMSLGRQRSDWGAKVIDRLSTDLKKLFPDTKDLSERNLKYMRRFAENWPTREFVQELLAQIPEIEVELGG